ELLQTPGDFDEKWEVEFNPSGTETTKTNSVAFAYYSYYAASSGSSLGYECTYTTGGSGVPAWLIVLLVIIVVLPLGAVGYLLYKRKQGDTSNPLPGMVSGAKTKAQQARTKAQEMNAKRRANAEAKRAAAAKANVQPQYPMGNTQGQMPMAGQTQYMAPQPYMPHTQAQMPTVPPVQTGAPAPAGGAMVMSDSEFQTLMMRQQMAFNQSMLGQGMGQQMPSPMGMGMGMQPIQPAPASLNRPTPTPTPAPKAQPVPQAQPVSMERETDDYMHTDEAGVPEAAAASYI
ncbi:hypothetical protein KIPB_008685, partial [Kipferlia bialata]